MSEEPEDEVPTEEPQDEVPEDEEPEEEVPTEEPEVEPEDESWDIDAEWREARVQAGFLADPLSGDIEDLWIFPVLLLYSGFFFGPFFTLVLAVFVLKGRVSIRVAAFLTGISGICWCLLQGLTLLYASLWNEYALQLLRSGLNFANGMVTYVLVRSLVKETFVVTRRTIVISGVALLVCAVIFLGVPNDVLIAMGR